MSAVLLLFIGSVILLALSILVFLNYWRYRYTGDKMPLFLVVFALVFAFTIISSLIFMGQGTINNSVDISQ